MMEHQIVERLVLEMILLNIYQLYRLLSVKRDCVYDHLYYVLCTLQETAVEADIFVKNKFVETASQKISMKTETKYLHKVCIV